MIEIPTELTIIPEDTEGDYWDSYDCPLARALMREGVLVDKDGGYHVTVFGGVTDSYGNPVGKYRWKRTGKEFSRATAEDTGTLVLGPA